MNNFLFENKTKVYFGKGGVKEYLGCLLEHCPQQSNLNLFQILRQIPSTAQHTVDFHSLYFIVDSVKHQILVYDHSTVSGVRAVDLAHFRGIAQFCDLLPQLF